MLSFCGSLQVISRLETCTYIFSGSRKLKIITSPLPNAWSTCAKALLMLIYVSLIFTWQVLWRLPALQAFPDVYINILFRLLKSRCRPHFRIRLSRHQRHRKHLQLCRHYRLSKFNASGHSRRFNSTHYTNALEKISFVESSRGAGAWRWRRSLEV